MNITTSLPVSWFKLYIKTGDVSSKTGEAKLTTKLFQVVGTADDQDVFFVANILGNLYQHGYAYVDRIDSIKIGVE